MAKKVSVLIGSIVQILRNEQNREKEARLEAALAVLKDIALSEGIVESKMLRQILLGQLFIWMDDLPKAELPSKSPMRIFFNKIKEGFKAIQRFEEEAVSSVSSGKPDEEIRCAYKKVFEQKEELRRLLGENTLQLPDLIIQGYLRLVDESTPTLDRL